MAGSNETHGEGCNAFGTPASVESTSVDETIELGKKIASILQAGDVLVLCGSLGAGKTHFSKGVALGLGVKDEITSPTFNILREYQGVPKADVSSGSSILPILAHWDLYRLDSADELEDVAFFDVLESGAISLIEWGDKFASELPEEYVKVEFVLNADSSRTIKFYGVGKRGIELVRQIDKALCNKTA